MVAGGRLSRRRDGDAPSPGALGMCVALRRSMSLATPPRGVARLHSGAPFWLVKNGVRDVGQPLEANAVADVAIVGAGLTGAFVADALSAQGLDVIVVDRNEPATGSSGASTALVMYDLDIGLVELTRMAGEDDARRIYRMSRRAVDVLTQAAFSLGGCGLALRDSACLASDESAGGALRAEADARRRMGLAAEFLDRSEAESRIGVPAPHGALLAGGGAQLDPLRLTNALLQRAERRGARLAMQTAVTGVEPLRRGIVLRTSRGASIRARHVVFAAGYELPPEMPRGLVRLTSTYALATQRLDAPPPWLERTLLWETARPYLYVRSSGDGRLIAGGEDLPYKGAALRDRLLPSRIERLERSLARLLPELRIQTAFAWAGTFAETNDCLPVIGRHPRHERAFVALGYGGNGMTFSAIAARLIADALLGRPNAAARLFAPGRDAPPRAAAACGMPGAGRITRTMGVTT